MGGLSADRSGGSLLPTAAPRGTAGLGSRLTVGSTFAPPKSPTRYLLHISIGGGVVLLAAAVALVVLAGSGGSALSLGALVSTPFGSSAGAAAQTALAADGAPSSTESAAAAEPLQAQAQAAPTQAAGATPPEPSGVPLVDQQMQGTPVEGSGTPGASQQAEAGSEKAPEGGETSLQTNTKAEGGGEAPGQAGQGGGAAGGGTENATPVAAEGQGAAGAGEVPPEGQAPQGEPVNGGSATIEAHQPGSSSQPGEGLPAGGGSQQPLAGAAGDGGADVPGASKCPPRCSEHGTCNEETGECHCLLQYAGDDCTELAMPSCHLAPGYWTPCPLMSTCECAKECHKYRFGTQAMCFRGTDEEGKKLTNLNQVFLGSRYYIAPGAADVDVPITYGSATDKNPSTLVSPASCPFNCSGHGVCERQSHACQCTWAAFGMGCEREMEGFPIPCVNGCSDKGQCILGTCKCDRGFFGIDCSLFLDRAGKTQILQRHPYNWTSLPWPPLQGATPLRPRIYVYDLPGKFHTWQAYHCHRLEWQEPIWFMERVLNSPYRTANPDEADFFYIPLWIRNRGDTRAAVVQWAKEYIQEKYPYWKKYGGMRHFVMTNSDWGNCEMGGMWGAYYGEMHPAVKDLFTVTLWGLNLSMHLEPQSPCFRPGVDIVMPPDQDPIIFKFAPGFAKQLEEPIQERTIMLYFRGYSAEDQAPFGRGNYRWSFDVRQEMFRLYRNKYNETGILLDTLEHGPWDNWHLRQMIRSIFCLAPSGWGWGMRTTQAVLMGCIPVVIQPDVVQPFEGDGLDWNEFAVVLGKKDIPNLEQILRAISNDEITKKREAMERVKPRFIWSSTNYSPFMHLSQEEKDELAPKILQQDAFEGIMEALRLRLKKEGKV